jgi:hypothetical protein
MDSITYYGYKYDGMNRLTDADASIKNVLNSPGTYTPKRKYGDENYTYDYIGNITNYKRGLYYGPSVSSPANWVKNRNYTYQSGNNRLFTEDSVGAAFTFKNYSYNASGAESLHSEGSWSKLINYNLNANDLVKEYVTATDTLYSYYDAHDNKIAQYIKSSGSPLAMQRYFLRDYTGKELGVYSPGVTWDHYYYGKDLIAIQDSGRSENIFYMIRDHLGSVRVQYSLKPSSHCNFNFEIAYAGDYYPYGNRLRHYLGTTSQLKYGYQGSEQDDHMITDNHYFTHFRTLETVTGRWMQVDPKANLLPSWSPYIHALANPILRNDIDGAYPWPIYIRSFICSNTVAGDLFKGDGRGPSFNGTSRVFSEFMVDPSARIVTQPVSRGNETVFYGIPGVALPMFDVVTPISSNEHISFAKKTANFQFYHTGKDPITPKFITPALDVHAGLSLSEDLEKKVLTVKGIFKGDMFPSTEAFIADQSKTKLFLGARKEAGGVLDLVSDNQLFLFKVDMQIQFDEKGNFTGVNEGSKFYSVEAWNKKVKSEFNAK